MKKAREKGCLRRFGALLDRYTEDLLIFGGLFFVVYPTFTLSTTAGYYSLGASLLGLGVWTLKHPKRKGGG